MVIFKYLYNIHLKVTLFFTKLVIRDNHDSNNNNSDSGTKFNDPGIVQIKLYYTNKIGM